MKIDKNKVLFYIGIFLIADNIFAVIANVGLNFGAFIPAIAGSSLIIWAKYRHKLLQIFTHKQYKIINIAIIILVILWSLSFAIIETFILSAALSKDKIDVDYAVVLGAGLNGEVPTTLLKDRLDASLNYIKDYPKLKLVVSGGQGANEEISEADAMKRYLIANNVDEKRIIKEEKSLNTYENIKFTKEILTKTDNKQNYKIMLITSDFHMLRAKILAKKAGFIAYGYSAKTPFYILPNYYLREYFAVVKMLIFK